jgi:copper(I)-binding protein
VKRPPVSLLAALLVSLLGVAGLLLGALPQPVAADGAPAGAPSAAMVVSGAYIREPANELNAAAYFTIYNTTATPDALISVDSGAGARTTLHTEAGGTMAPASGMPTSGSSTPSGSPMPGMTMSGGMSMTGSGFTVPAHGSLTFSPGKGHAMIEQLYGSLKAGQTVNLRFSFEHAGEVLATVPVIGITAPAPTAVAP